MTKSMKIVFAATLAVFSLVAVLRADAQPTITDLGTVANGSFPRVFAAAGEGWACTGTVQVSGQSHAFRWTAEDGMQVLPLPPGSDPPAFGYDVTAGAGFVVGDVGLGSDARAFKFAPGVGTVLLPAITGGTGRIVAAGLSADSRFVVGSGSTPISDRAVIWDTQTGTHEILNTLTGGTYSLGLGISANGAIVAGEANIVGGAVRTYRWAAATGMQDIGVAPGAMFMFCGDLSADGNAVVGTAIRPTGGLAYVYLNVGSPGGMITLPLPIGATTSGATGVSGNGSIIVGKATVPGLGDRATLYTSELGTVDLNAYLSTLGVDLTGWRLTEASGITDDGRAIVGNGFRNNAPAAWIVRGLTGCGPSISASSGTSQACAGRDAEFFVGLDPDSGTVTYAWRVDGLPIDPLINPSAATNRLSVPNISAADAGVYDCVITNACGSTTSPSFTLTVLPSDDPRCCPADFNNDEVINSADFFDFVAALFLLAPAADFNEDGQTNSQDFFDFLAAFFAGC